MKYIKLGRSDYSKCNICLKWRKMTEDHVPPKGSLVISSVEQENVFYRLTQEKRNFSISQNGVKYKTLCSKCNNKELGLKLDPVLNDFSNSIANYLNSTLDLPRYIEIETIPNLLIRAILGHLMAAKIDIEHTEIDSQIRNFVFDYSKPIPDEINIFFWIYPYKTIVIGREFGMPEIRKRFDSIGIFSILKFFPIAYLLSDLKTYNNLPSITNYKTKNHSDKAKVTIDLKNIKPEPWPIDTNDGNFIFLGSSFYNSSIYAQPKRKG